MWIPLLCLISVLIILKRWISDPAARRVKRLRFPVKEGDSPEKTEKIPFRISEDGYVVLPSQAEFSDLKPLLLLNADRGPEVTGAVLEYLLGTRTVGQAVIALPESMIVKPEPETVQNETESEPEQEKEKEGKGFRWWYIPWVSLALWRQQGAGFLIVRRQIWKYRWRKNRKMAQKQDGINLTEPEYR